MQWNDKYANVNGVSSLILKILNKVEFSLMGYSHLPYLVSLNKVSESTP